MCSYNMLKAWMQKDSDRPLGADKHLIAGTVAGIYSTNLVPEIKIQKNIMLSGMRLTSEANLNKNKRMFDRQETFLHCVYETYQLQRQKKNKNLWFLKIPNSWPPCKVC